MTVWLASAYGALAVGLAWLVAGVPSWRWRATYIVAAPALALGLWLGRPDPRGWPTPATVPAHATLQWAVIDEPDPARSDPGRIYLWLDLGGTAPRAYSLPYSRSLHRQVEEALHKVGHGQRVALARTTSSAHAGRAGGTHERRTVIHLYPHPLQGLPPKAAGRSSG